MKLRIRSAESKETLRLEVPDFSSFSDLKALIAGKLSSSSSSSIRVAPESIRLSLNRKDDLVPDSPSDTLYSLGITSGDLLFFSLAPSPGTLDSIPAQEISVSETLTLGSDRMQELLVSEEKTEGTVETWEALCPGSDSVAELRDFGEGTSEARYGDVMDVDMEPLVFGKSCSVPCFLKRVLESEKGEAKGNLGFVVIAVHAVFLESGFVVSDGNRLKLPEGWASAIATLSVRYTLPEIVGSVLEKGAKVALLKFSLTGSYVSIYGFSTGDRADVYRVCLDVSKVLPLLSSSMDAISEVEEKEVFNFWRTIKDGLSLPLLIDICDMNGLPSPPCFSRLPVELKFKILESLPGIDIARAGCANSELRFLSSNDELWKRKFLEEFGLVGDKASRWKNKFAQFWSRKKYDAVYQYERRGVRRSNFLSRAEFPRQRFPIIGGDYDRFPAIGGFGPVGPRSGFLLPGRRNFSPRCDLGPGGADLGF